MGKPDVNDFEFEDKPKVEDFTFDDSTNVKKKVSTKDSQVSGDQNLPLKSVGKENTSKSQKPGEIYRIEMPKNLSAKSAREDYTPDPEPPKETAIQKKLREKPRTVAEFNQEFGIRLEENDYKNQEKVLSSEHQEELLDKIDFKREVAKKQEEYLNKPEDNYLWAFTRGLNKGTIKLLKTLDGAGRILKKTLPSWNTPDKEGIFGTVANYMQEKLERIDKDYKTPDTIRGSVLEGFGSILIDAPLMMIAPETKLGYMSIGGIKSVPGIATYLGTTNALNTYQELDKKNANTFYKIKETGISFAGGIFEGAILHGLGYASNKTGALVKGLTNSNALGKISTIGTGSVSFGGLTAVHQFVSGQINTKEIAAQTILGGALTAMGVGGEKKGIKEELQARQKKAMDSFFTTKSEDIEKIHNIPQTVEQLREKQLLLEKQIEKETDPDIKEQMQITSQTLDNFIDIKYATKHLLTDPTTIIDRIQKDETLSDIEKKHYTDKINDVVAKTDPRIQATKPLTAEIEKTDANIEAIKNNESLSDLQKSHIVEGLESKKKDLSKSINEEMSKPIDMIELDKYEQLKSEEYEKENEGSIRQEGDAQIIGSKEKSGGEEKSSPEHKAEKIERPEGEIPSGKSESQLETEKINKEFLERQKILEKNIPETELKELKNNQKMQDIFDKVTNEEIPTKEEINFVNDNAWLSKGYEFGEKGLQKIKKGGENATQKGIIQESGKSEYPGVSQREDLPENKKEVRESEGQRPSDSSGVESKKEISDEEVIPEFVPEEMKTSGTKKVSELKTEPEYFQYKPESDAEGKTKGVEASLPTEENPVTVWKEGDVVIEGHNKLNRAKEEGIEDVPVKYISAKTKEEALAKAAFENVKKGEMAGLTKTDKGYKIDKTGVEFDNEGNIINKSTDTSLKREAVKENTTQEEYAKINEQLPETKDKKLIEQSKAEFDKDQSGFTKKVESKVRDVIKNKVGTAKDLSDMLLNSTRLKNRELKLIDEIIETKDKVEVENKQKELLDIRRDIVDNEIAGSILGTQSSSIFNVLKNVMKDDYSLASIRKRYLASRGLTEATPEMEAHINKLHERNLELEKRIKDIEARETDLKPQNELLEQYKEESKRQRKSDRNIKSTERINSSNVRISKAKEELRKLRGQLSSGVNPEAAFQISIIAKEKVYQGAVKLNELVKNIFDDIKDIFPDWTEKDVRDHLAYVQKSRPISEEAKIGQVLKKTAQIQKKIEEKDYSKKQREIKEDSPELRNAKIEHERFKEQLRMEDFAEMYKNKHWGEKTLDYIFDVQRAMILSYISTIGKIGGVVAHNLILKLPELTVQKGLSKVLPKIYNKAEIYGPPEIEAIGSYYAKFIKLMTTEAASNFKDKFSKGSSEYELLYGEKRMSATPYVLQIPGKSHAYIKSFVQKPEFEFAVKQIVASRLRNKIDITRPEEIVLIKQKAYEHAEYSILMNKNKAVNIFKDFSRSVGRHGGQFSEFVVKSELPLVRVATNYIARTLTYEFGMFKALIGKPMNQKEYPGLIKLAFKGTKELTTEQAEFLAKNLTKGVFGLSSSILFGYFLADHYNTVKQKDKDKPKKGSLNVLGSNIGKTFLHSPFIEGNFVGASIRNEIDNLIKNGAKITPMDYVNSLVEAEKDIIKKTPFVQQLQYGYVGQLLLNKNFNWGVQTTRKVLGMVTPGFVKEIAKYTSDRPEFIKTETAEEEFYSTFPFLRNKIKTEEQRKETHLFNTFLKLHKAKEEEKPYYNVLFKLNEAKNKSDKIYKEKGVEEMSNFIKENDLESDIKFKSVNSSEIEKLQDVIKYMRDKKDNSENELIKTNMDKVTDAYEQGGKVRLDQEIIRLYYKYLRDSESKNRTKKKVLIEFKK